MPMLVVFQLLALCISCTVGLVACIGVEDEPEHKVTMRTAPSVDAAEELLEKFGSDLKMNASDMEALFKSVGLEVLNERRETGENSSVKDCFTIEYFYGMYSRNDGNINKTDLLQLCPAVLYQLTKEQCHAQIKEIVDDDETAKENPARAWGFGFLFVTIISVGSLIGASVVPMMNKPFYKKTLMCMVSLAVGVLGGSGIFHLIPKVFGLPHLYSDKSNFLWKSCMIFAGLYVFLVLECVMKLFIRFKDFESKGHAQSEVYKVVPSDEKPSTNGSGIHGLGITDQRHSGHAHIQSGGQIFSTRVSKDSHQCQNSLSDLMNGASVTEQMKVSEKPVIATVAWMIIIGDGLHNIIDGLAIGASFSGSVIVGISTSLAVICEELPHELGDFAILLNSGMSYKQAMFANFLSACLCYVGLVIGLVLGYTTHAVTYIYGIAGGMFIYISLVNMLPEALEMAYVLSENSRSKSIKMLCLVNFAIVFGFFVMLVLALYGDSIKF